MSEILAPAGDKNSAFAAINAGADAIYLGLKQFSARNSAENFDGESLKEILNYAHLFGVRVYVAMNTLVKGAEVESFLNSAIDVWNAGADAFIISDVFLGAFLKESYPQMVLHLSTQAGVCNACAAQFAKDKGFSRVILSRETSLDDIKSIAKIIETEVFVQGALCTCFSGQCYFSSFVGGNSGNRGKCKQPCRKLYSIDKNGFDENSYKLSLSDLSVGEDIKALESAGVTSFKIEGRMRRPEYVSAAVGYYRSILSGKTGDLSALKRTYNRGNYTKGLAFGQDKSFLSPAVQGHIGEFVGVVKVLNGKFVCLTNQNFVAGDGFKILRDGKEVGGASFGGATKGGFYLSTKNRLKNGDKVFITTDAALNSRLLNKKRSISVKIDAALKVGSKAEVVVNGVKIYGESVLERSEKLPITRESFENCFKKVDKYPFEVTFGTIELDEVFVPTSVLNALRREAYKRFFESLSQNTHEITPHCHRIPTLKPQKNAKIAAICANLNGVVADIGILKPSDYDCDISTLLKGFKGEKYIYLPPFMTDSEIEKASKLFAHFDGIYCEGIYGFELAEKFKMQLFAGVGMNFSNPVSVLNCGAKYIALSKELTAGELNALSLENTFCLGAGAIKLMDLVYCPFGKKCGGCDRRGRYTLTDENGRKFPMRRYRTSDCRFEIYNCVNLVSSPTNSGTLVDCTLEAEPQKLIDICKNEEKLRERFKNYTRGHFVQPIL